MEMQMNSTIYFILCKSNMLFNDVINDDIIVMYVHKKLKAFKKVLVL